MNLCAYVPMLVCCIVKIADANDGLCYRSSQTPSGLSHSKVCATDNTPQCFQQSCLHRIYHYCPILKQLQAMLCFCVHVLCLLMMSLQIQILPFTSLLKYDIIHAFASTLAYSKTYTRDQSFLLAFCFPNL